MSLTIAIQPDEVKHPNGEHQSFSECWTKLARDSGINVVPVDAYAPDIISQLSSCDAFMWRCTSSAHQRLYAKRLLYAIERGLGLPVFPSLRTWWYFEDKIAQFYYFHAAGIPTPATNIFWSRTQAEQFCDAARYPFVLKLAGGLQAANVRLVRTRGEAQYYIDQLFGPGAVSLAYLPAPPSRLMLRRLRKAVQIIKGRNPNGPTADAEMQHGYIYAQEFIPDNDYNIRVTVIGNRIFGFRMLNRPKDFRASLLPGSLDWNPEKIGEDAIRLAYKVSRQLRAQTIAADIIYRDAQPVIIELTFNYASWAVRDCPGHWIVNGKPDSGELEWIEGPIEPADATFDDFLADVEQGQRAVV